MGTGVGEAAAAEGAKAAGEAVAADAAVGGGAALGAGEAAATVLPEVVVTAPAIEGGAALGAGELAGGAAAGAAASALDGGGGEGGGGSDALTTTSSADPLADPTADIGGLPPDAGITYPGGGTGGDPLADPTSGIGDTSELGTGDGDAIDKLKKLSNAKTVKDAFDKVTKYGPLALGGASALQSRAAGAKFRQQLAQIGGPQRAVGEQLLNQFQSGQLMPGDAARIAQWEQSALAQSRQYFARAGQSSGTSANTTQQQIKAQAEAMRQQALQGMMTTGINTLNVTDRYQAAALNAEMEQDRAAAQAGSQFLNAYGSWLRAVPQITGEKPAEKTTA